MTLRDIFWNRNERRIRAFWRLLVQVAVTIALSIAAFALFVAVFGLGATVETDDPLLIVASTLVLIASVWICAPLIDRRSMADFGVRVSRTWFFECIAGVVLATFCLLAMLLVFLAAGWGEIRFVADPADWAWVGAWFVAFACVGYGEELFSRGYQLRNIAEGVHGRYLSARGATLLAAAVSSVLFGLMHVPNPNMTALAAFNLCVAGIVLVVPALLTGRLALSVGFHTAWNFVMGNVLGFPVSGLHLEHSVYRCEPAGPEWITGGAFGPEGGVIGLATDALAIVLLVLFVKGSEGRVGIRRDWAVYVAPAWRRMPEPPPVPPNFSTSRERTGHADERD